MDYKFLLIIVSFSAFMTFLVVQIDKHIKNEWANMILKFAVLTSVFAFGLLGVARI